MRFRDTVRIEFGFEECEVGLSAVHCYEMLDEFKMIFRVTLLPVTIALSTIHAAIHRARSKPMVTRCDKTVTSPVIGGIARDLRSLNLLIQTR